MSGHVPAFAFDLLGKISTLVLSSAHRPQEQMQCDTDNKMDKDVFLSRLQASTRELITFTRVYATNILPFNSTYLIVPNVRKVSGHLNEKEIARLTIINECEGKELQVEQCLDLLWDQGKVPLWVNMSVYDANSDVTVIELYCSRRFREEDELNHKVTPYPPFGICLPHPLGVLELKKGEKFDIRWRKQSARNKIK